MKTISKLSNTFICIGFGVLENYQHTHNLHFFKVFKYGVILDNQSTLAFLKQYSHLHWCPGCQKL